MKSIAGKTLILCAALLISTMATADSRIEEVWTCKVNAGSTLDQVKAANTNWVKYVNKNVAGGDIRSSVVTTIVGTQGEFIFVDSFPSMASWVATKDAMTKGDGMKIEEALTKVATCDANRLYNNEAS